MLALQFYVGLSVKQQKLLQHCWDLKSKKALKLEKERRNKMAISIYITEIYWLCQW